MKEEIKEEVKEEVKENPAKAEIQAKIDKYEKEVEAYKLVGQLDRTVGIQAEIDGLNRLMAQY